MTWLPIALDLRASGMGYDAIRAELLACGVKVARTSLYRALRDAGVPHAKRPRTHLPGTSVNARHHEWLLAYCAGESPASIARRCGVRRQSVAWALDKMLDSSMGNCYSVADDPTTDQVQP